MADLIAAGLQPGRAWRSSSGAAAHVWARHGRASEDVEGRVFLPRGQDIHPRRGDVRLEDLRRVDVGAAAGHGCHPRRRRRPADDRAVERDGRHRRRLLLHAVPNPEAILERHGCSGDEIGSSECLVAVLFDGREDCSGAAGESDGLSLRTVFLTSAAQNDLPGDLGRV
jgi:hypothetical protein